MFIALKSSLITLRRRPALQMDMASVAQYAAVEVLVKEFEIETQSVPVEIEGPRQILDPEDRSNMVKLLRLIVHRTRQKCPTFRMTRRTAVGVEAAVRAHLSLHVFKFDAASGA